MQKLWKHQREALNWSLRRHRLALFMEMRLGKTRTIACWANTLVPENGSILLLAPLSTLPEWQQELEILNLKSMILRGSPGERQYYCLEAYENNIRWFLTNYNGVYSKGIPSPIILLPWSCLILDESTAIRNPKAHLTKMLIECSLDIPLRAILTGLPDPESSLDYFCQMQFLYGEFLSCRNFFQFRNKYFKKTTRWNWSEKPGTKKLIRESLKKRAYRLDRKSVGLDNKVIYERRYGELDSITWLAYYEAEKLFQIGKEWTNWRPVSISWMHQLCGGRIRERRSFWHDCKLNILQEILQGELAKQQIVIWAEYKEELNAIACLLAKLEIRCVRIDGNTSLEERKKFLNLFKEEKAKIMIAQIRTGMFGLNLSIASAAIYFSNTWSALARRQSEDRLKHPERKGPILIVDLLMKYTIDEDILSALKEKKYRSISFVEALAKAWKARK